MTLTYDTLNDSTVPDYTAVTLNDLMEMYDVSKSAIYRRIGSGELPAAAKTRPLEWTIGQLRDWRLRKSLAANEKQINAVAKMQGRGGSCFDDALASS